jgi:hypothetical protein
MTKIRTYTDLSCLHTLEDRFEYLALPGDVAQSTFGFDRWINQSFYHSREWRDIRSEVIVRDNGCDMALPDFPIAGSPRIHHMNPLSLSDIEDATDNLLDPEFLISVSHRTHNAIHYGNRTHLPRSPTVREIGDTRLW